MTLTRSRYYRERIYNFFLFVCCASFLFSLGGIGLLWSALWFLIIFETPAAHPRISREEREEIETAIGSSVSKKKPTYVPWYDIFTAPCVWAIVITHATSVFGYFTIVNQLPTYMKEILHFDIKQVGNWKLKKRKNRKSSHAFMAAVCATRINCLLTNRI